MIQFGGNQGKQKRSRVVAATGLLLLSAGQYGRSSKKGSNRRNRAMVHTWLSLIELEHRSI
jgi:hypothetical protein